ncbi:uncharacterized protein LOC135085596 [Ostrinia nubilalis]|uniref:uncharacterized protein LOC135085596 n=1 Tax=Ostrinia nubilalis TaxID=29057 RepID=UPI00308263DB
MSDHNQFQKLFDKIKIEMQNQTKDILSQMDEKLSPIKQELEELRLENLQLKDKLKSIEKHHKKNNIIIHGLEEGDLPENDLLTEIKEKFKTSLDISLEDRDINKIMRLGKKDLEKSRPRPVLIEFVNNWKKNQIMKNKKHLKDIFATEDYPKDVLQKRKQLLELMHTERSKGNYAVIIYDKLIIKENNTRQEKRKRGPSSTPPPPQEQEKPQKQHLKKAMKTNAFDGLMRNRNNLTPTQASTSNSSS